ncbi:fibrillin-1-like, partial [Stylophora pistillata]|uniref:fibrillin-1-like n=1 Tax=Stylophora pistillata TaxID=50429 RepID=UPI000C04B822
MDFRAFEYMFSVKDHIDECAIDTHNCSNENVTCQNTNGSFLCICKRGFIGDIHNCTDIDECSLNSHNCSENSNCTNTEGSYNCSCNNPGFRWDGHECKDIDEYSQNSHNCGNITTTCNNTRGSFECICRPGFIGDRYNCTDVDECAKNVHNCTHGNSTCQNIKGSFKCICKSGFHEDGRNCIDIDECSENIHNCSRGNATCTNTKGSFNCSCNPGYIGDGNHCRVPKDCAELYRAGQRLDGIFQIDPDGAGAFDVFCDQTMDGGGWIVFQRKLRGSYNFNKDWNAYKNGFGNLSENFWLGLDKIHRLTNRSQHQLYIYQHWSHESHHFTASNSFHSFKVRGKETKYTLELSEA